MNQKEKEYFFLLKRKKGISNRELADYIGCSESLISRFERNQANMSKEKIEKYREGVSKLKNTKTITFNINS